MTTVLILSTASPGKDDLLQGVLRRAGALGLLPVVYETETHPARGRLLDRAYLSIERLAGQHPGVARRIADPRQLDAVRSMAARFRPGAILALAAVEDAQALASETGCPVLQLVSGEGVSPCDAVGPKLQALASGTYLPQLRLLVWLPGEPSPRELDSASARPISGISLAKNDEPLASFRESLWAKCLEQLARRDALARLRGARIASGRKSRRGSFGAMLRVLLAHARHRMEVRQYREFWEVGIRRRSASHGFQSGDGYQWLDAPSGNWFADPFVVEAGGGVFVFVEEFDHELGRGVLSCVELDANLHAQGTRRILVQPHHLSYPQVFGYQGDWFMIPESGGSRTVDLYRAKSFPYEWEFLRTLKEGPYFDTTLHMANGRFWFFTSYIPDPNGVASQLQLFSADSLDGKWRPHPASPLSLQVADSRPAGALFGHGGRLIRPAQDCRRVYGGNVNFQAIDALTDNDYRETLCEALTMPAQPEVVGAHTYNSSASYEVIDRLRKVRSATSS